MAQPAGSGGGGRPLNAKKGEDEQVEREISVESLLSEICRSLAILVKHAEDINNGTIHSGED